MFPNHEIFYSKNHERRYTIERRSSLDWAENSFEDQQASGGPDPTFLGLAIPRRKLMLCAALMVGIFSLLAAKIAHLQIVQGDYYHSLSEGNRVRIEKILPERGIIFDRSGRQLVRNIPNFTISVVPIDLPKDTMERTKIFQGLGAALHIPVPDILSEIEKHGGMKYPHPIVIKDNIEYEDAIKLKIASAAVPGLLFDIRQRREYITADSFSQPLVKDMPDSMSHLVGYTGTINERELKSDKRSERYLPTDKIGKTGIEYAYEEELRGVLGEKQIEVDALGKEKKVIAEQVPVDGTDLYLTIDLRYEQKLEEIVRDDLEKNHKQRAAAVVLDPNTGEILALSSLPTFDNNAFARGITQGEYEKLTSDENQPLFNRVISGMYPSGSTVKPAIAAAALNEGIVTPQTHILSTGGLKINQWFFPDWKAGGHGQTDVYHAIAWSVNSYFYYISGGFNQFQGLGVDRLSTYLGKFGLGKPLGIDLPGEAAGFVPSKQWKELAKQERWYIGDTYHMGIGQGDLLVTPLQVATWTAAFANGGVLYQPHLVDAKKKSPEKDTGLSLTEPTILNQNMVRPEYIAVVKEAMGDTVNWGSAQRLKASGLTAGAKTGTAQWHSEKSPHAWFTAFAPYENPQLVITVLVEEGGEGAGIALDIAKQFLEWAEMK